MIVVMSPNATPSHIGDILSSIESAGLTPLHMPGTERVVLGALGDERALAELHLEAFDGVESVKPILTPYKLVSREMHPHDSVVGLGGSVRVGGERFVVIAGPCSVETSEQMHDAVGAVVAAGAHAVRGGAFKPRSSPYSFQGLGQEALDILVECSTAFGVPTVTEVVDTSHVDAVAASASVLQVGARNMQNYELLKAVGAAGVPVILKRGLSATLQEFLLSAEYLMDAGCADIVLCERGIRTFETATRNTLDLGGVAYLKNETHLPVIVDPSHAAGRRDLVPPLARAALAAGADGLIIEVHPDPATAWSDGAQSLTPHDFSRLMDSLAPIATAVGRTLA